MYPPHLHSRRGFSLVEIVLAIGIISFAGMALIGLLGVGLNSSKEAVEETTCGLVARYIFTQLQTEALSAEDLSSAQISPFNPTNMNVGLTETYYFTREGVYLGATVPSPVDPNRSPFYKADAVIKTPAGSLAKGVANQGVSEKELRAVALSIRWPVISAAGAVPAGAKAVNYSLLLSKNIYRKSLEGDR